MINVAISKELHQQLKIKAVMEGKTLQELVNEIIKKELDKSK